MSDAASRSCCAPKCYRKATIAHAVRSSYMSDSDAKQPENQDKIRRYEVCLEHDVEFFGRGGFLTAEQSERIKSKLAVAA